MAHKVLIVSGHPALASGSTANKAIIDAYRKLDPSAEVRDLGALYPDFKIDAKAEQDALVKADVIVMQFPVYWYQVPALMKKWFEDVFTHGFAYGTGGDKLHGRTLLLSCTTGSPEQAYTPEGPNSHPLDFYLNNYEQSAKLCGMKYAKPLIAYGMLYIPGVMDDKARAAVVEKAQKHAKALKAEIDAL
jgi:glutathione-regulated potassium-efflux system ancillary protein KefF